ncbi:dual specificity protein phosphatase 22-A isoform X3 [Entelurus aequoreus]|uniref:dual specificity protein phosphatase 22-A isoform X3 n=1 Tax=Entelurus aequoreus TaxID=161455 RepID=UPI002B1E8A79|nr:dual specificity protein phosphatase 22-A isoform X3 [Entelurus aequoreus]
MGNGMNKVVDGLYLGNIRDSENRQSLSQNGITHILSVYNNARPVFEDKTYLCIHAADASSENLLAGVSRSTTMVVAYLMTVTHYSWEECLTAVKAVRSFVGPNSGFQEQLRDYQTTQVSEKWLSSGDSTVQPIFLQVQYRAWLKSSFNPSPFNDPEQVGVLLVQFTEQQENQQRGGDHRWRNQDIKGCSVPTTPPEGSS